jgi:Spirocyclase AveC-like
LWYGKYYQMPIYEAILAGAWCVGYASLLYFRNDKGQTLVERGIEKVKVGAAGSIVLRFLAFSAICAGIYMVTYNIPYWIINNTNQAWPAVNQENSYWTNGICGPETDQACPSPALPMPTRHSGHFDPQGDFVVRDGSPAPADADQVTQFRTK